MKIKKITFLLILFLYFINNITLSYGSINNIDEVIISGYISNMKDYSPIENAVIKINDKKTKIKTNSNGYYELKLKTKTKKYKITFLKDEFYESGFTIIFNQNEILKPTITKNHLLKPIEKNFKIKGKIIDRLTGNGISTNIIINNESTFSDFNGYFEFLTYPLSNIEIKINHKDYFPFYKKINLKNENFNNNEYKIDIFLEKPISLLTLQGYVLDKNTKLPIYEAIVEIDDLRTITNENGYFKINLNNLNNKTIICYKDGYKTTKQNIKFKKLLTNKINITLEPKEKSLLQNLKEKYEKEIFN